MSDGKVATRIVDVVVILDKVARADVPFVSQTIARLARGGCVNRALGGVLSRAHRITGREGVACCHEGKGSLVNVFALSARTKERTIYPGIQRFYHRLIYACLLPDRGTIGAVPRCA